MFLSGEHTLHYSISCNQLHYYHSFIMSVKFDDLVYRYLGLSPSSKHSIVVQLVWDVFCMRELYFQKEQHCSPICLPQK